LKEYVKKGYIKRVWVGVIPLKGQRDMNWAMPRDLGEAQGLRIEYKFKKFYEA
jgi:putative transposase